MPYEDFEQDGPIFSAEDKESTGDNMEAYFLKSGRLWVQVENPWAGDSYSGFGRDASVRLTKTEAIAFANWILNRLAPG